MREGQGTLKELTTLWRQLDPRGRWTVVETAYGELRNMKQYPECRSDMPSQAETLKLRKELEEERYEADGMGATESRGEEKGIICEAEGTA